MKIESENRKLKFLSQLRKHLRSPGVEKMLGKKKRRMKRKRRDDLKRKKTTIIPNKISPQKSLQSRVIRRAGEKLKESLKRFWNSDEIQEKRNTLINYAIKSNKIVTASKVVTQEDVKKLSQSKQSTTNENSNSESPTKKNPETESRLSLHSSSCKEFYIHCSSAGSSCPSTPERPTGYAGELPIGQENLEDKGECSATLVSKTTQSEAHDDHKPITSIRAIIGSNYSDTATDDKTHHEVVTKDLCDGFHLARKKKIEFDFKSSEKLHQNADKLIEQVAKEFGSYSKKCIVAAPTRSPSASHSGVLKSQIDHHLSPTRYSEHSSYPASTGGMKSSVLSKENYNREISSDQMIRFRPRLLGGHEPEHTCTSSTARCRSLTRAPPEPFAKKSIFLSSSDSDSENEVLVRMKMATRRQDVTMGFISSARRQVIPPITSRMFDDAVPSISDSDSSFSPYEKPCFLH